ncbi:integrase protein [Natrinema pellirubrum DSM 15624]|uniref:Integrase protein n=1 Tax=Natrinema pellirubrum (strain DSM 15624 / CIP 106293 / JCM 10476 / NCIMB 786 / 157) TaxID=797303 RepID=L0JJJ3_NATP1|nr:site-specific integrase [Natrinema pellirubrum]AGB31705.1 site-specific recombinase XerD [Natrinema pellirubrum DSM 15624]ELY72915.1 integrase protein [Natrinema pellirubrum DSM 15624]
MSADSELSNELQRVLQEFGPNLKPLSPNEAVQKFLANEKSELAPNTLDEYERELTRFVDFCDENDVEDTTEFDGRVIHDFKIWRRDKAHDGEGSLSNKTMRDEMYLFRKFLRFLESIDAVTPRLYAKIEIPTLDPGEGERDIEFASDELNSILTHLEKYEYATREHAVWVLFAATGRRPSGLRALDLKDVHLDEDEAYIEFHHRVDGEAETRLKNKKSSENTVHLAESAALVLQDYIDTNRVDVTENSRSPLLTTTHGRLSDSSIRKYVYKWSRPCVIGNGCPEGRTKEECEAIESSDCAVKCPFSKPPVALRHGYISNLRRQGVSLHTISDRCDVSEETIEKHYSELTDKEKRELRREELETHARNDDGYL